MAHQAETEQRWGLPFAGALVVGALTSLALGFYGREHEPTFESVMTLGFPTQIEMKVWLASTCGVLALVQLVTALRIYGKFGSGQASRRVRLTHRTSGVLAVVVSLPVVYHCLWSLGFQTYSTRVFSHALLGCAFYGAFVTKMLVLRIKGEPGWLLPVVGGATFAILIGVVSTSAAWWVATGQVAY